MREARPTAPRKGAAAGLAHYPTEAKVWRKHDNVYKNTHFEANREPVQNVSEC